MSTTTTTATATDLADVDLTTQPIKKPNKGRMTATWHHKHPSQWDYAERALVHLGIAPQSSTNPLPPPPVFAKDAPVPVYPVWKMHRITAPYAFAPLLLHWAFTEFTGISVPVGAATVLYLGYFIWFGSNVFRWCNGMAVKFGTFDGTAERDGVPDVATWSTLIGLLMVVVSRALIAVPYLYKPDQPLFDLHTILMLPVNMFFYALAVDFYFYWYHRLMHEVPFLWRFHRKHHTTKHPIAALGAFADHEQEFFDMVGIPVLAWLTYPINFPTWWIATCYILFIEAAGHSGLRGYFQNPSTWPLRYLGMELCLEDHDIHHRQGWRKSGNYGKQTRFWDALFGTMKPRIEGIPERINWNDTMDKVSTVGRLDLPKKE